MITSFQRAEEDFKSREEEEAEEADSILAALKDSRQQKDCSSVKNAPRGLKAEQSLVSLSFTKEERKTFITPSAPLSRRYEELFKTLG